MTHDHDDHEGHDHGDHEGHDHEGHDHEGHDHEGHDHEGHDHEDHEGHDHGPQGERPPQEREAEGGGAACQLDLEFLLPGESDEEGRFAELKHRVEALRGVSSVHLRADAEFPQLCVHYDTDQTQLTQVLQTARAAGAEVRERYVVGEWFVREVDSPQTGRMIEYALGRLKGVLSASMAFGAERLVVEYDTKLVKDKQIRERVEALGHPIDEIEDHVCPVHQGAGKWGAKLQFPLVIISGVLTALGFSLSTWANPPTWLPTAVYAVALAAGGFFPIRGALKSVQQGRVDIETLMVLSGAGAALLGAWLEGALLLFLFSLGHALEHRAMESARNALNELGNLRPETARVQREDGVVELPVAEVVVGDRVVVRPGDRVPLDGVIREGSSALDQAVITGESIPVNKGPGDDVFAGTVNTDSALEIEVTKLGGDSVIARVMTLVARAEANKSPTQRFTQRLEERFVPVVLVAAIVFPIVLYMMGTPVKAAVLRAVSLLVAASPCALAISVPAAVLSAVANAARKGILVKGGSHLEELGLATAIAFDKTGTLTRGEPKLTSIETCDGVAEADLLGATAAAETLSSHPLARAITDGADERGIAYEAADSLDAVHGKGVHAKIGDSLLTIGNAAIFDDDLPAAIRTVVDRLHGAGETTMIVKRDEQFLGVIGVADTVRDEAAATIKALHALGIKKTMMLTGDNARVAKAIGDQVGIDEVHGPLMPDEKVATMKRLARDAVIVMVGDGVNDAPALATASVGVAMGGAGADVALETADIVLMGDNLRGLTEIIALSRRTSAIVRQNLVISLGISAVLVVAAIAGWAGVSEAIVLHEGSTLIVAFNGIRLLRG